MNPNNRDYSTSIKAITGAYKKPERTEEELMSWYTHSYKTNLHGQEVTVRVFETKLGRQYKEEAEAKHRFIYGELI